ncbi:MAG: hypothetical protein LBK57_10725 [Clostridiales Family XIII bacterium]|nr:hypothetical protein [Clostridiales Family XIII bacterium]
MKAYKRILIALIAVAITFSLAGAPAFAVQDDVSVNVSIVVFGEEFDSQTVTLESGSTVYDLVNVVYGDLEPVWETVPDFQYPNVTYEALFSLGGYESEYVDYYYDDDTGHYVYVSNDWIYTVDGDRPTEERPGVDFSIQQYMDQYVIQNGDVIVLDYDTWYEQVEF